MNRKRTPRWPAVPPRGLRPKLQPDQVSDLALVHNTNLDAIAMGDANETTLMHVVEAALTWSRVAQLLGIGEPEMLPQVLLANSLLDRFQATGKVLFTGTEYQLAKKGVQVMDMLAEITDQHTASLAVEWCDRRIALRQAEFQQRQAA